MSAVPTAALPSARPQPNPSAAGGSRARPADAVPPPRRRRRRRPLPQACRGPARHRRPLRRQGQPGTGAAGPVGVGRLPFRRGQPRGGGRRPGGGSERCRPRVLQPGQTACRRGPCRRAGRQPVRRRLARGDLEGGRRGPRVLGPLPPVHLRRRRRLVALAQVRLLPPRGGRDPPVRVRRGSRARPACRSMSGHSSATRRRGTHRSKRRLGCSGRCAGRASTSGCWIWAVASRPTWKAAVRRSRRTARPSSGT